MPRSCRDADRVEGGGHCVVAAEDGAGPPVRFHGERQVREPVEQRAQRDLAFHLRQGGTDAVVDAGRERQVLSGISPGDVEALRVCEHGGVAVGTAEQCDDELAGPHVFSADLDGVVSHPGGALDG